MMRDCLKISAFVWLCVCLITATNVSADNLLRASSFERIERDILFGGYNRYNLLRDDASIRLSAQPPLKIDRDDVAFDDLLGDVGTSKPTAASWRRVTGKGVAFHGDICLATELTDPLAWGVELEAGAYCFSFYARTDGDRELLRVTREDIRGKKGEIRDRDAESFKLTREWQRYTWSTVVKRGPATFFLEMLGKGKTVYVDAVQLEPGKEATPYKPHPWDEKKAQAADLTPPHLGPRLIDKAQQLEPELLSGIVEPTAPLPKAATTRNIPLTVAVPIDDAPASGGIPIPRGEVFDAQQIVVVGTDGNQVPAQVRVLSRHVLDSSIQMVLVDLIAASPDAEYQLKYGPDVMRSETSNDLEIQQDDLQITVNTGPLKFNIRKQAFSGIDSLSLDLNNDGLFSENEVLIASGQGQGAWTADATGKMYWSEFGKAHSVTVEEAGPIRVCIAAKGAHCDESGHELFRYTIRIHAYAGKPYLRIEHTFTNEQGPFGTTMNGAGLRLHLNPKHFERVRFSREMELIAPKNGAVFHVQPDIVRTWLGKKSTTTRTESKGWVIVRGSTAAVTSMIRQWPWMPPKEFYFNRNEGLDICVWARHLTQGLAVPFGLGRSHRIWLNFHAADQSADEFNDTLKLFHSDLRLEAAPSWYCNSTVFGQLTHKDETNLPQFEQMLQRTEEGTYGRIPRKGEYRWHDFVTYGDDRGDGGWSNMETMVAHSLFLMYVRSLDDWYYRRAIDAAEHYREIDIVHPWGQTRVHGFNHTYLPWDGSHQWIKGVLDHYLLTGDRRSLEVAHEQGRWIRSLVPEYEVHRGTRRFTRLMQNLADLYRFTGHKEYYDNFIARLDETERQRGDRTGISRFQLSFLREDKPDTSFGRTGFMQWYAMAGLHQMARATEQQRFKDTLVEEMDFIFTMERDTAKRPQTPEDYDLLGIVLGKSMIEADTRNRIYLPALSYYAELTNQPGLLNMARLASLYATTDATWKQRYPNIGHAGHVLFAYGLYDAQQKGITAEQEAAIIEPLRGQAFRAQLRDAGFEETASSGYNAWGFPQERTNLALFAEAAKDSVHHVEGETSLRITEKNDLDIKFRRRLLVTPHKLTRQRVRLTEVGWYMLTGHVRFDGHARPDITLHFDTDTGKQHQFALNLTDKLPAPRYGNMELNKPKMGASEEVVLEDPNKKVEPKWWRFETTFPVNEAGVLSVRLQYHIGQRAPGSIWFDGFGLKLLEEEAQTETTIKIVQEQTHEHDE